MSTPRTYSQAVLTTMCYIDHTLPGPTSLDRKTKYEDQTCGRGKYFSITVDLGYSHGAVRGQLHDKHK